MVSVDFRILLVNGTWITETVKTFGVTAKISQLLALKFGIKVIILFIQKKLTACHINSFITMAK